MASPKLRKPPFPQFLALVMALPELERLQVWAWVYSAVPEVRGLDLVIELQRRLRELGNSSHGSGAGEDPEGRPMGPSRSESSGEATR